MNWDEVERRLNRAKANFLRNDRDLLEIVANERGNSLSP
jgi:hypothetical protein